MLQPVPDAPASSGMPSLYFELTTPEERKRHHPKLASLTREGGLLIDVVAGAQGESLFEIVTMDWSEPGLLDRIFEAILRCHGLEGGIAIRRARVFTGAQGQVVNLLELSDRQHQPLTPAGRAVVLQRLSEIQPGERGALETIRNFPYRSLIPLVEDIPSVDNSVSEHYTCIALKVERISNRFTSVLLHFLARSELWLNIQVARFEQGQPSRYLFYVVDKHGLKLRDSAYLRQSLARALEAINGMLTRFNLHYLRREWDQRIEQNHFTIYHSRPRFDDFRKDLVNIRQVARLKGFSERLSHLVEEGLLDSHAFYFLKRVEAFVNRNLDANRAMVEHGPGEGDVERCRQYFEFRRQALRIMIPLFNRLAGMPSIQPLLSPPNRLTALCRPLPRNGFALDGENRLFLDGPIWLGEPSAALDSFLLMARTDCYLRRDLVQAIEASLEGWNEYYIGEHREEVGGRFLAILDESIRQGNTPMVLRNLRSVGLLERFVPGFAAVQGRIHINADHAYTVDEHTFAVIEVLLGLRLLDEALPGGGATAMRADYGRLENHSGLINFARKYAMELRMLRRVIPLRNHAAVRPFFHVMEEVRRNSLEYLIEVNLLEHSHDTCMIALNEFEAFRHQVARLARLASDASFSELRVLVLAGLLHDLKKPAVNHGELSAAALDETLAGMGLKLPPREVERLRWLVGNHLEMRPLMNQIGSEGEGALLRFVERVGDPSLVRGLILFTYADRVAVRTDYNANAHDAMVLGEMLARLEGMGG
jgi:hypothetical protein